MLLRFCDIKSDTPVTVKKADIPEIKRRLKGMAAFFYIVENRPELRDKFDKFCADISENRLAAEDLDEIRDDGDYAFFKAYLALNGELMSLINFDAGSAGEGAGDEFASVRFAELAGDIKLDRLSGEDIIDFEEISISIDLRRHRFKHCTIKRLKHGVRITASSLIYDRPSLAFGHLIRAHMRGNETFYSAIGYLLARCRADRWPEMRDGVPFKVDGQGGSIMGKLSCGESFCTTHYFWREPQKLFVRCIEILLQNQDAGLWKALTSERHFRSAVDFMIEFADCWDMRPFRFELKP
ncbi:hypothetical protein IJT93_09000 [bacterium]|nr:hypothetical protein [bacterium]